MTYLLRKLYLEDGALQLEVKLRRITKNESQLIKFPDSHLRTTEPSSPLDEKHLQKLFI